MNVTTRTWKAAGLALALVAAAACETQKSSNPLSPSVAGPIAGVEITSPQLLEPGQGFKYRESQQPIRLLIANASTNGVRPLTYTFEIATDSGFTTKVFARAGVPQGEGGQTAVQADRLEIGRAYYWRARAEDGANTGLFAMAQFEVLPAPHLGAPTAVSPVNNERVSSRRPALVVSNSDRNAGVGALSYDYQVAADVGFGSIVATGRSGEGSGQTSWTVGTDLAYNVQYFWRARSTDGETTSGWSATQSFRSPLAGAPAPAPPAPGGGSCASNDGNAIVQCVAARYPQYLAAGVSHNQRVANMEFLRDRVIEAGLCGGMDLAWNLKRGVGPRSIDAIAWRVNGIVEVVDIGVAYDDPSIPLQLTWGIVAGPAGYDPYPRPSCQ